MRPSSFYPQAAAVHFLVSHRASLSVPARWTPAASAGCPSSVLRDSDARDSGPDQSLGFPRVTQHSGAPAGTACVSESCSTLLPRFPAPNAVSVVLRPCRLPADSGAVFWGRDVFVQPGCVHMGVDGLSALRLARRFLSAR